MNLLRSAALTLICLTWLGCDEPDPITECRDVVRTHCLRLDACTPLLGQYDVCVTENDEVLECLRVSGVTSSLDRCREEMTQGTCATYGSLPSSCYGAFSKD
jgi:hypothetical protein